MKIFSLGLTVAGLLAAAITAQSTAEVEAIARFKRGFKPDVKALDEVMRGSEKLNPKSDGYETFNDKRINLVDRWRKAIDALQRYGSVEVAQLIPPAWQKIDKVTRPLWAKLDKTQSRADAGYQKILKLTDGKGLPHGAKMPANLLGPQQQWLKDCREASEIRRAITDIETLHDNLRAVVSMMNEEAGLQWLLAKGIGDKNLALPLKVAAVQSAARLGEPMVPALTAALERAKSPDELCAIVHGIGLLGQKANSAADKLIGLLGHDDAGVREYAALALQQMKQPASIKPMVDLLVRERGHAQRRIAAVLEILTSQQHGTNIAAWQRWLEQEGADWVAGKHELGKGKPSAHEQFNKENYYFGIPQDGAAIVYILDCSGSMIVDADNPKWRDPEKESQPVAAAPGASRSDASKNELIRALKVLSSDKTFNIVWYNHRASLYKKKMVKATPEAIEEAIAFIKKLPSDSSTNIFDALKEAFTLTGRGSFDGAYNVLFDTIFLLTDGKPTLQGLGNDDPMRIVEAVRKWNSLKRVVIHTIAMGDDGIDHRFMHALANENRGVYRKMIKGKVVDGGPDDKKKPGK